jgi:hypothetical protein
VPFSKIVSYDGLPVFFADDLTSLIAAAARGNVPRGLSIALMFGDVSPRSIQRIANTVADLAPTVVHCFGPMSEAVHDGVDSALVSSGRIGIPTHWSTEYESSDVVFELCCTDSPAEEDFERWSGRLFFVDESMDDGMRKAVRSALQDVDGTIRSVVRGAEE